MAESVEVQKSKRMNATLAGFLVGLHLGVLVGVLCVAAALLLSRIYVG